MHTIDRIPSQVAVIRDLIGGATAAEGLPHAVDALDDQAVIALLLAATEIGKVAEQLRALAAGVISGRSSRQAGQSGLAQVAGHRSALSLVQQITGESRSETARRLRVGEALLDGASRTAHSDAEAEIPGEDPASWQEPLLKALNGGKLTLAQYDVIRRGLGDAPLEGHAAWSAATLELIAEAGECSVEELMKSARCLRDRLDPAGAEDRFIRRYEQRSFRMWIDREGVSHASLTFDDESAQWVRNVIDSALSARRGGPRFVDAAERQRAEQLVSDPRSNDQLTYDLMMDVLRAGSLADAETVFARRQPGVRVVRVLDSTGAASPVAHFEDDGATLPLSVTERITCNSGVQPVEVDRQGDPLRLGRERRLYTPKQRIALAVRDGGCRWAGCDRPASFCEAHHIDRWHADHGRTDVERGILLCRFHHMQLHHSGWRITREPGDDFVLHPPGGGSIPLTRKFRLRRAWCGSSAALGRSRIHSPAPPREEQEEQEEQILAHAQ